MEKFKKIFSGLERAYGMTYVDKKGADGQKIKGKSFVQRGMVTDNGVVLILILMQVLITKN